MSRCNVQMSDIDIDVFLLSVAEVVHDKQVPVVDLIAIQTKDPFKVLVATILSARTKDETTAVAAARLFAEAETPEILQKLSEATIEKLIYPVGFFRNKAKFLKKLPDALQRYDGCVPETIEELVTLPGVGRKTANLVRSVAFGKPAICVDTHVHRIMNIWGYVDTKTPLETEMALREKLPEKYWLSVNSLLVAFGQFLCKPVRPHCDVCPLAGKCLRLKGVVPRKVVNEKREQKSMSHKIISWNVNGIRAVEKKGFLEIIADLDADILAFQETKAQPEQLSAKLIEPAGYTAYYHSAERKGYSGVAVFTRIEPVAVVSGIGEEQFDCEGRVLTLEFEDFFLVNCYFPNSGQELKRLQYKLDFNQSLLEYCEGLRKQKAVVICGDYNVAHKAIDLRNPKQNVKNAGFTPEERAWMDHFLDQGYLDTFRMFCDEPEQYTWWSYRFNARSRNIGWRIDYFCVNKEAKQRVVDASILPEVMGSDHCPVQLIFAK